MKYLLVCDQCGAKTPVDASQAGGQVVCPCGATLVVPSFRAIRELESVEQAPLSRRRQSWNPGRGVVFVAGILIALIGVLLTAAAGVAWVQTDTTEYPVGDLRQATESIEQLGPAETWDLWVNVRDTGLGPYRVPGHIQARQWVDRCRTAVLIGLLVVVAGIAIAASPLVFVKKRRA
jgi:hypothetical protein